MKKKIEVALVEAYLEGDDSALPALADYLEEKGKPEADLVRKGMYWTALDVRRIIAGDGWEIVEQNKLYWRTCGRWHIRQVRVSGGPDLFYSHFQAEAYVWYKAMCERDLTAAMALAMLYRCSRRRYKLLCKNMGLDNGELGRYFATNIGMLGREVLCHGNGGLFLVSDHAVWAVHAGDSKLGYYALCLPWSSTPIDPNPLTSTHPTGRYHPSGASCRVRYGELKLVPGLPGDVKNIGVRVTRAQS